MLTWQLIISTSLKTPPETLVIPAVVLMGMTTVILRMNMGVGVLRPPVMDSLAVVMMMITVLAAVPAVAMAMEDILLAAMGIMGVDLVVVLVGMVREAFQAVVVGMGMEGVLVVGTAMEAFPVVVAMPAKEDVLVVVGMLMEGVLVLGTVTEAFPVAVGAVLVMVTVMVMVALAAGMVVMEGVPVDMGIMNVLAEDTGTSAVRNVQVVAPEVDTVMVIRSDQYLLSSNSTCLRWINGCPVKPCVA